MRIVFVTARYAPYIGGVEAHVSRVTRMLVDAGHSATVLTADPTGELPPHEDDDGVEIVRVRARPKGGDYFFAPGVARVIRERRWDVAHIQSYHTFVAPIAMLAARRSGLPYVVTPHGGGHSSRLRHAARSTQLRAMGPLLRGADRIVATAAFELELYGQMLGIPRERFVLIPNGSDLRAGPAASRRRAGVRIASLGRLERYKGHHLAVAALPHVLEREPDARLWIAGQGPYEEHLRRLVRRERLDEHVEIGAVPVARRSEYVERLEETSLAVLLSEFETHPLAVIEAVALGCPALVGDTSGLRELADAGYARAVPLDAPPAAIATAMLEQIAAPPGPPLVLPTWDDCRDALIRLYAEASGAA